MRRNARFWDRQFPPYICQPGKRPPTVIVSSCFGGVSVTQGELGRRLEFTSTGRTFSVLAAMRPVGEKLVRFERTFCVEVERPKVGSHVLLSYLVLRLGSRLTLQNLIGYIETLIRDLHISHGSLVHLTRNAWLYGWWLYLQLLESDQFDFLRG